MQRSYPGQRLIAAAERVYRLLLFLYPMGFRRVYGTEMVRTFRDCARAAFSTGGGGALLKLWIFYLYELLITGCIEHYRSFVVFMKRLFVEERNSLMAFSLLLDVAQQTDRGLQRPDNEDTITTVVPEDPQVLQEKGALFVVADGLGGHQNGKLASEIVVDAVRDFYYKAADSDVRTALQRTIQYANDALRRRIDEEKSHEHAMGTTCIAAVIQHHTVYVANVGDCRAYIAHKGVLRQISEDHSVVAALIRKGELTAQEALNHPERNKIYRCMGLAGEHAKVDLFVEAVEDGDILVLCSDGLTSVVNDDDILRIIEAYEPQSAVQQLVQLTNEKGGPDNVSIVVAHVSTTN